MELALPLLLLWMLGRGSILAPGPKPQSPGLAPPALPGSTSSTPRPPSTSTPRPPGPPPFVDPLSPAGAAQNAATAAQQAQAARQTAVLTQAASVAPAPFPAVTPSGLAPWPSGWKPHPAPGKVAVRAMQLLPVLWQRGQGSRTVEKHGGEWVSFVAQPTSPGKKGVTAWVERNPGMANV